MANFDTNLFRKGNRHRGVYGGKEQSVTGVLRVAAGASIATTDLIRAIPMGENTRPIRVTVLAVPVAGNPVLTNATFDVGVAPLSTADFERPSGEVFPPLTADVDALVDGLVLGADNIDTNIAVTRPVAASVPAYAPYVVTMTPSGIGAFSVAGGDIDLSVTVVFLGEQLANGFVYDEYVSPKVSNNA